MHKWLTCDWICYIKGKIPLHYAYGLSFSEVIQPLQRFGADETARDHKGRTPKQYAGVTLGKLIPDPRIAGAKRWPTKYFVRCSYIM